MHHDRELTTQDLQAIFGCSAMTVYNWERGRTGREILPAYRVSRGTRSGSRYHASETLQWAQRNRVRLADGTLLDDPKREILLHILCNSTERPLLMWHRILTAFQRLRIQNAVPGESPLEEQDA